MKILVLTSVYKDSSLGVRDTSTNIVNSFAIEWVKQGHEVVVIHNAHCYPAVVHLLPTAIKKKLAAKMGFYIADYDAVKRKEYSEDGVKVIRIPITKYVPHKRPNQSEITKQIQLITNILKEQNYVPDVITGHWASPQMEIVSALKGIYNCNTAIVLHGMGYINSASFCAEKYLHNIDFLGCRSRFQAQTVQQMLGLKEEPFVCYSGVPDEYLGNSEENGEKFKNIKKWKFAYVGRLISYKKVDATIKALSTFENIDWEFNIIGDGASRSELESLAKQLNCENKVNFLGRVPRDNVMEILNDTHVFVMISINEIFGLVYLESMAAHCITVASKNGGVDGIVVNGVNGYLCEEGNVNELIHIINEIINTDDLHGMSHKGYKTALEYSDSNVARMYLRAITEQGCCEHK